MSSADPHRPGLSEQLKYLDSAQGPLAPSPFDLDDIVAGGRRRRRRRTALNATGAAAAVIAVVAAVALGPLGHRGGTGPDQVAGTPTATAGVVPDLSPIDAGAKALTYAARGKTVTASLDGKPVATLAFTSWTWSGNAGKVVLTVTATRPFTIDPMTFNLVADDSNENSPTNRTVSVGIGTQDVALNFDGFRSPGALLWTPQEPKTDDDDGIVIYWELTAANRT
jgi:hypothetical protein